MKKIYMSAAAVLLAATLGTVTVLAASGSSITVKTDKSQVSYTYKASDGNEAKADASKLFGNFEGVSSDKYSTENFTITSRTENGKNIEVLLVIETENLPEQYSPLDYYSFVITDDSGEVIYDDAGQEPTDPTVSAKEISFGLFNTQFTTDTKKYTVDYRVNEDIALMTDEETISGLGVSVMSRIVAAEEPAVYEEHEEEVEDATYTVEVEVEDPNEVVAASAITAAADSAAKDESEEVVEISEVQKVCGKDIPAGRYLVSGNGIVLIESADGEIKSEATITDGTIDDVEGVKELNITITDGDVITAQPLPGQEKPSIRFEKMNTGAASAATAASTASASAGRATPTPTRAAAKSNPKTGEDSAEVVWLCTLMAFAAAGIAALEIFKRRKV